MLENDQTEAKVGPSEVFFQRFVDFVDVQYQVQWSVIRNEGHKVLHVFKKPNSKFIESLKDSDNFEVFGRLLPDFHVFAWCRDYSSSENPDKDVELKIVLTSNKGRVLGQESYVFKSNDNDSIFVNFKKSEPFLINRLISDKLTLCQGTVFEARVLQQYFKEKSFKNVLIEDHGWRKKVVRSKNCYFSVFDSDLTCMACQEFQDAVLRLYRDSKRKVERKTERKQEASIIDEFIKKEQPSDGEEEPGTDDDDGDGDSDIFPEVTLGDFNTDVKYENEEDEPENNGEEDIKPEPTAELVEPVDDGLDKSLKECPKCSRKYSYASTCKKHILKCDGVYREPKRNYVASKQKKPKVVKSEEQLQVERKEKICPLCLMEHKKFSTLQSHINQHKTKIDLDAIVSCPLCQREVQKQHLNEHFFESHPGAGGGMCCECLKIIQERESVKHHFARHHKYDLNNVLCTECGKGFRFHHQLRVHFAEVHDRGGSSTVVCDQCGKTFNHRKRLVSHLRASHRRTQKFECHLCEKFFYQRYKLGKHLLIHSGHKPWKCRHCAYRSVRRDNVLLHCRKVHHLADANAERDVVRSVNDDNDENLLEK